MSATDVGRPAPQTPDRENAESLREALARAGDGPSNKGNEAARAAIEMVSVVAQLAPHTATEIPRR